MTDEVTAVDGAEAAPVAETPTPEPEAKENTQESATATDNADPTPPRDDKGRFVPQERVNEITRARREAEREAQRLRAELEEVRKHIPRQLPPEDRPPSLQDYGNDPNAYAAAIAEHVERRIERRTREQAEQQARQTVERSFESRAQEYARTVPDFDAKLDDLTRAVQFPMETVEVIGTSEYGPAVVYHLAQHLDVADRIARLPAHLAAAELARIEAKVSAPKPTATTKAPAPVPTLSGASNPVKDPAKMSYEDYKRHRMGGG